MRIGWLITFVVGVALAGLWGNIKFMMKGEGLPSDPAARQGFIVGKFMVPTVLLGGGMVCGAVAARQNRR